MITFGKLGRKGNLGNQLFQIASTIGIAIKNDHEFGFEEWQYQSFFKNHLPKIDSKNYNFKHVLETKYEYHDWGLETHNDYDLEGWLQSEKYFQKDLVKHYFEFNTKLKNKIDTLFKIVFEKPTILISIRRGDFVRHPDYYQTPIKYYLNALYNFFPDWVEKNLVILSDDISYCKYHFSFLNNAYFGDNLSVIEQLYLGTKCDHFIISNSTFSWWSAWLGERESSIIIAPFQNFRGEKSIESNDKDFYPDRWNKYNFEQDKIPLKFLYIEYNDRTSVEKAMMNYYFYLNDGEDVQQKLFLKPDYIISPVLIYYCNILNANLNIYTSNNINKVSGIFDRKEFIEDYDFGIFSTILRLSKKVRKIKIGEFIVEPSLNSEIKDIYVIAGRFKKLGGFKFQFLMCKRNIKKSIKVQLKRLIHD